ncbi:MAG: hypothetical protein ACSHYB_07070 [Roseibacillus sp.]
MLLISFWFGFKTDQKTSALSSSSSKTSLKSARLASSRLSSGTKSDTELLSSTRDSRLEDFPRYFAEENDPLERLSLLLLHLDRCSPTDFRDLATGFLFQTVHERTLFFDAWMRSQGVAEVLARSFEMGDESFQFALNTALQSSELAPHALAWQSFQQPVPEQELVEVDVTLEISDEGLVKSDENSSTVDLATQALVDFPKGLSVHSTARRISEMASRASTKARSWIRYSADRRAVLQSAIDVGWNSADLSSVAFNDYLQTLDPEVASLVAAGYLQQLAAASPETLPDVVADLGSWTNIDLGLYLVIEGILSNPEIGVETPATLVSYIGDLNLQGYANELVANFTAIDSEVVSLELSPQISTNDFTGTAASPPLSSEGSVAQIEAFSAYQNERYIEYGSTAGSAVQYGALDLRASATHRRTSATHRRSQDWIEANYPGILGD